MMRRGADSVLAEAGLKQVDRAGPAREFISDLETERGNRRGRVQHAGFGHDPTPLPTSWIIRATSVRNSSQRAKHRRMSAAAASPSTSRWKLKANRTP